MERQIRRSALLVTIGLIVALVSLLINHPLAFIMFLGVAVTMIAAGMLTYLFALVREPSTSIRSTPPPTASSSTPRA